MRFTTRSLQAGEDFAVCEWTLNVTKDGQPRVGRRRRVPAQGRPDPAEGRLLGVASAARALIEDMGKVLDAIDDKLGAWIEAQHVFFVATAPLAEDGHVNVSPKGDLRWFRVLGPHEVAYLDFVGSGAETIAHARENGRIVVMFCAFDGPPRIVRLHGRASVLLPASRVRRAARALRPARARACAR